MSVGTPWRASSWGTGSSAGPDGGEPGDVHTTRTVLDHEEELVLRVVGLFPRCARHCGVRVAPLGLRNDRERLEAWVQASMIQAGLAQRARIVLQAADGLPNVEIAARVGVSRPTVTSWRARYERSGIGGPSDQAR